MKGQQKQDDSFTVMLRFSFIHPFCSRSVCSNLHWLVLEPAHIELVERVASRAFRPVEKLATYAFQRRRSFSLYPIRPKQLSLSCLWIY
jgi:hypothetical protein